MFGTHKRELNVVVISSLQHTDFQGWMITNGFCSKEDARGICRRHEENYLFIYSSGAALKQRQRKKRKVPRLLHQRWKRERKCTSNTGNMTICKHLLYTLSRECDHLPDALDDPFLVSIFLIRLLFAYCCCLASR